MDLDIDQIDGVLGGLNLGKIVSVTELIGGSSPTFKLDLSSDIALVLKVYPDQNAAMPARDAFATGLLKDFAVPVTRYLLTDESKQKLPFRFAVTNYLPGVAAGTLKDHPDAASLYRQIGSMLRSLHAIAMPAYGAFDAQGIAAPVASNAAFMRRLIEGVLTQFAAMGPDSGLVTRLRRVVEDRFDAIVPHSQRAVFAHSDLHPNNVLAVEDADGRLRLSGLIDFGFARAADPVFDLAKCLFCSEHDAPGSTAHILDGYGKIDHPDPDGALWYYTLLHRMAMWRWLRHLGVIPTRRCPERSYGRA